MEWARVAKAKLQTKYILLLTVRIRINHIIVLDLFQRMKTLFRRRIMVRVKGWAKWKTTIQYLGQHLVTTIAMLVTTQVTQASHHHLWIIPKPPMSSRCSKCRCRWCHLWRDRCPMNRCSSWCSNSRWWCRWHWCSHRWVGKELLPCKVKTASILLQHKRPLSMSHQQLTVQQIWVLLLLRVVSHQSMPKVLLSHSWLNLPSSLISNKILLMYQDKLSFKLNSKIQMSQLKLYVLGSRK